RSQCKRCGASQICGHGKQRSICNLCGGGSICEHGKHRSTCKLCGGGRICEHEIQRQTCQICDPIGHLRCIVSNRVHHALKRDKTEHSIEYLGCTIEEFKDHIADLFQLGMTWDNYGDWQIDHIIPIKYNNPTIEQVIERLHWKNT